MARTFADVKSLLKSAKLEGLSGNGETDANIALAEEELQLRFPGSYRQFLREYGWGYFGGLELIVGLGADIPSEMEQGTNVVRVTLDERNGPLRLPVDLIPVSPNGAGDWYAIDTSRMQDDEAPVVFVSHERVAGGDFNLEQRAENFADWLHAALSETRGE